MSTLLNQVGEDLAYLVQKNGLPTTELDVEKPRAYGIRVLDTVLITLAKDTHSSSLVFVSKEDSFPKSYINSMAVLMTQPEVFTELVQCHGKRIAEIYPNYDVGWLVNRLIGKRLHTLRLEKLVLLSSDLELWESNFNQLLREAKEHQYCFVVEDIPYLMKPEDKLRFQAYDFYGSLRLGMLKFMTGLSWDNYVNYIERGRFPAILHFCTPILLTPRPSNLPAAPIHKLSPDKNFDFTA